MYKYIFQMCIYIYIYIYIYTYTLILRAIKENLIKICNILTYLQYFTIFSQYFTIFSQYFTIFSQFIMHRRISISLLHLHFIQKHLFFPSNQLI